jgi:hypothetical protein
MCAVYRILLDLSVKFNVTDGTWSTNGGMRNVRNLSICRMNMILKWFLKI